MALPGNWGPDEISVWHSFVTDVTVVPEDSEMYVAELFDRGMLQTASFDPITDAERREARDDFFEYFYADERDWRGDWEAWKEYMGY